MPVRVEPAEYVNQPIAYCGPILSEVRPLVIIRANCHHVPNDIRPVAIQWDHVVGLQLVAGVSLEAKFTTAFALSIGSASLHLSDDFGVAGEHRR